MTALSAEQTAFVRCPAVYGIIAMFIREAKERRAVLPRRASSPIEWAMKIRGIASRLAMGPTPEIDQTTWLDANRVADSVVRELCE